MNVPGETATGQISIANETPYASERFGRAAKWAGKATTRLAICAAATLAGADGGGGHAFTSKTSIELIPGVTIGAKPDIGPVSDVSVGPIGQFPYFSQVSSNVLASSPEPIHPNKPAGDLDLPAIHTKIPAIGNLSAHAFVSGKGIQVSRISRSLGGALGDIQELIQTPIVNALEGRLEADAIEGAIIGLMAGIAAQGLWALKKSQLLKNPENMDRARKTQQALIGGLAVILLAEGLGTWRVLEDSRITPPASNVPFKPKIVEKISELASIFQGATTTKGSDFSQLAPLLNRAVSYYEVTNNFYSQLQTNIINTMTPWVNSPLTQENLYGPDRVVAIGEGGPHCSYFGLKEVGPTILSMTNARLQIITGNIAVSANSMPPLQNECATFAYDGLKTAEQATGNSITGIVSPGSHDYYKVLNQLAGDPQPIPNPSAPKNAFVILNGKPLTIDGITFDGLGTPRINDWGELTKVSLANVPTNVRKKLDLPTEPNAVVPADTDTPAQNPTLKPADTHNIPEIGLYWSGKKLAESACNTNHHNIEVLVTNSPEQEWLSGYRGCADMALAGEGPAYSVNYISPVSHKPVFQVVQTSSGGNGADCNFWPLEKPDKAGAQYRVYSFNTANHQITYANIMLHSDASVTISPWHNAADEPVEKGNFQNYFLNSQGNIPLPKKQNNNPNAC